MRCSISTLPGVNTRFNAMMDDLIANGATHGIMRRRQRQVHAVFHACSDASMADLQQELLTVLNDIIGSM